MTLQEIIEHHEDAAQRERDRSGDKWAKKAGALRAEWHQEAAALLKSCEDRKQQE